MEDVPVLAVSKLAKTFRKPFSSKSIEAVRGVSFEVERGQVYGFLGPNGAGKSTTLKMITGLVAPTSGSASLFGAPFSHDSLRKVGFLPENPYVHPHLSPREFVTLCARLSDMREPAARVSEALARTGVGDTIDRPARTLSKGTLQRVALAAALVHEPELLILDEPMGGLDPAGRKHVRDLVLEQKAKGNSVLLSSHVLSDVELLCDRVCILRSGSVAFEGPLAGVLDETFRTEITLIENQKTDIIIANGEAEIADVLERALARGARVVSVTPKRETLEELFVRRAL
ncbi:ABC transporter ATP-binding protein [Pendulispora brunnea]|uniref:ABC transporter ATP-binding protein n=1 Tax=Pendulispora brunnea TaxID=2905690 RepID=A0ABZ2K6F5_9BACT